MRYRQATVNWRQWLQEGDWWDVVRLALALGVATSAAAVPYVMLVLSVGGE